LTLVDESAVHLPLNLPERWRGFFRECFPARSGEILRYRGPTGYRDALASHPMLPLVSPHPFDSAHCPAERWYLADPGLAVRLNDKGRLAEMTDP
jgi:hypothetical protein